MTKRCKLVIVLFLSLALSACKNESITTNVDNEAEANESASLSNRYIDVTTGVIGEDFELICKKSSASITEVTIANISNIPVTLQDNQKLYAIWATPTEYYIIEDKVVVGLIVYEGSVQRDMSMKQYFLTDDFYNVSPSVTWEGSDGYFCWQLNNAYLILGAVGNAANADQYYNLPTTTFVLLDDISQFNLDFQLSKNE